MTRDKGVQALKDIINIMMLCENRRITEVYKDCFREMIQKMEKGYYNTVLNEMRRLVERSDMTLAIQNSRVKRKEKEEII